MKKFWVFASFLLCGGCLPAPGSPPPAAGTKVVAPAPEVAPAPAVVPCYAPAASLTAYQDVFADGEIPAAAAEETADEFSTETVDSETVDPETVEDIAALAGDDQIPPEDEGKSVAAEVAFDFPVVTNAKVLYFVDYFSGPTHQVFQRWLERSTRYLPMMQQIFAEEGLPLDLVYLAMIESGFNDRAYSWAHAAGPWQFIEGTGRLYGLENDWWRDERRDPAKATRAAARHLRDLHDLFEGDWYLAVAAYNAGSGKIRRAVEMYGTRDFWEISHGDYLKPETKNYLPKLLAALLIAKEPEKYGFTDLQYQSALECETVTVPSTTDLEVIAGASGSSYQAIKELNPELKRWCTPPGTRNYEVRIPAGNRDAFLAEYARIPENRRANYQHHKIKPGDTLGALARRYGIRVADIVTLNRISNPKALRVGTDLILPLQKGASGLVVADLGDDYQRSRRPAASTYKVRSGDSLWKIARRFDVSEKELRSWNKLAGKSVIRPGQTLVVSAAAGGRQAVAAKQGETKKTAAKKSAAQKKIVYQVQPGDTLYGIGRQFKVATRQIMDWNNLSEDHILQPGDRLTLLLSGEHRS